MNSAALAQANGFFELAARRGDSPASSSLRLEVLIARWLEALGFGEPSGWIALSVSLVVLCSAVLASVALFALIAVWAERKVSARMQCRLGPMEVGPHGILQTIADGAKLLAKEDLIPAAADKVLYVLAPILVFTGVLLRFVPIPLGRNLIPSDLHLGLFYLASLGALEVIGIIMAGWSSNNKWSLLGTMRAATQLVSYEIPIGLAFLSVIAVAGTFSVSAIVEAQGGWFGNWFAFRNPFLLVLFGIYMIASLAECRRSPFDLPEAESELVSGFHTEYSGMRFALFFLAEYAAMYLVSAIAAVTFLGGWWTGVPPLDGIGLSQDSSALAAAFGFALKAAVLISKTCLLVFVQMWIRWTVPRIRLDQMMFFCWKILTPIGLVCLLGSVLWDVLLGDGGFFGISRLFEP